MSWDRRGPQPSSSASWTPLAGLHTALRPHELTGSCFLVGRVLTEGSTSPWEKRGGSCHSVGRASLWHKQRKGESIRPNRPPCSISVTSQGLDLPLPLVSCEVRIISKDTLGLTPPALLSPCPLLEPTGCPHPTNSSLSHGPE